MYARLRQELPRYKYRELDLADKNVLSLTKACKKYLDPETLQSNTVEYVVSITGLENSLFEMTEKGLIRSDLIAQLNFERELIFCKFPFIIILWSDENFVNILNREALDLSDWMNYRFVFRSLPEESPIVRME